MAIQTKTYGKGRTGPAMVSIVGDKVNVTFEDNGQTITCLLEDAPDYIRNGRQSITMNAGNTQIYGARPLGGTFKCEFAGFAAREGEPPTIREVAARSGVSANGKKYSIKAHLEFTALFDIVAGKWKGYRLVYNLPYGFEKVDSDEDIPTTMVLGAKLADFLSICGLDFESDTIPWSDNVLVYLEKVLASRSRTVLISLNESGWVKDIGETPDEDEEDEDALHTPVPQQAQKETKKAKPTDAEVAKQYKDMTGQEMEPVKKFKKEAAPSSFLDIMASQAAAGDQDAKRMLVTLAASNEAAREKLEELMSKES